MLWEEYYEKIGEWATGTAVSRMSQLTSYGPPEEIIDAILTIGFDDKTGASRLLRKATAAGVKFSGDQLAELYMLCSEETLNHAIRFSSDIFTAKDLEDLYCNCSDDILLEISRKHGLDLPEELMEDLEPDAFPPKSAPVPAQNPYIRCPNCGKNANSNFCPDCGYDLRKPPVQHRTAAAVSHRETGKDFYLVNTKITPEQFEEMIHLLSTGNRRKAIKKIRQWTPLSPEDATHIADNYHFLDFQHPQTSIHVYREEVSLSDPFSMPARKKTKTTYNAFGKRVGLGAFLCGYGIFYIIAKLVKPYLGNSRK